MRRTIRRQSARWAVAVVSATTLVWLASSAQAAPLTPASPAGGAAPLATAGIHPASPAGTGASDVSNLGSAGWKVQSSAAATQTGAQVSTPGFDTGTWLPVSNDDAGAPGTEIEALAQNGKCPGNTALEPVNQSSGGPHSVFFSTNIQAC
jgi:exo-1,4-beta-D-glucosaminidase